MAEPAWIGMDASPAGDRTAAVVVRHVEGRRFAVEEIVPPIRVVLPDDADETEER